MPLPVRGKPGWVWFPGRLAVSSVTWAHSPSALGAQGCRHCYTVGWEACILQVLGFLFLQTPASSSLAPNLQDLLRHSERAVLKACYGKILR